MLKPQVEIRLANENFILDKHKCAFWVEEQALLLSDVHAGKAAHFRKNGIPISTDHLLRDLNRIEQLLVDYNPKTIYFLGDLFHTHHNEENELIQHWSEGLKVESVLIAGNHDIHSLPTIKMKTLFELEIRNVMLTHEPSDTDGANICGHLHPGFSMAGSGRSRISLPAFYLNDEHLILPSFGSLTGKRAYKDWISKCDVFPITEEGMFAVSSMV